MKAMISVFSKATPNAVWAGTFFFTIPFRMSMELCARAVGLTNPTNALDLVAVPGGFNQYHASTDSGSTKVLVQSPGVDKASEFESEDVIPCRGLEPWFL